MNEDFLALARFRVNRAKETLSETRLLLDAGHLNGAVNRLYYAAFYAARAILATKGLDSSKHSGVISLFNREFVKEGIIPRVHGKTLTKAFKLRSEGDYQDFKSFTREEIEKLLRDVTELVTEIEKAIYDAVH